MNELSIEKLLADKRNLERVLDNLKDGIIAHDLKRRIFFFNREAENITGHARDEVLGRDCHDVFGMPFCGEHCAFCGSIPQPDEHSEYTLNIVTKSGENRRVRMSVTRMNNADGDPAGVLACLRDETDLLELKMRAAKLTGFGSIIGRNPAMLQVFQQIRDVAGYDYPVHIAGETGTGKELVASAIHGESPRAGAPFVPINCGALPEGLIESELFGHVKGAFSGAVREKKGRFELADTGTIFLDEVAELSPSMQVKLLRFLQEGTFEKVGGENLIKVNVRVISATNKDLKKLLKNNSFREDLFYRLNVIPIRLPALRERKTDIPLLVKHFLQQAEERYASLNLKISQEALSVMMDYNWPGNVRELQNAVQFAIVKHRGDTITADDLPLELRQSSGNLPKRGPGRKLSVDLVAAALRQTGGNKAKAAGHLGVGRATLYRFLNDHPEFNT